MINVTDLRNGVTFKLDDQPYIVLKYEHIKMGRGTASIKIRAKNLLTGSVVEKGFISGARVDEVSLIRKKVQFLYRDGETYNFMDPKTFEQVSMSEKNIENEKIYLKDGMEVDVLFLEDQPLAVELPPKMEFKVVETGPGVKGNSATNIYKAAVLDNGMTTRVPLFINQDEKIYIDTRTGEYVSRVTS